MPTRTECSSSPFAAAGAPSIFFVFFPFLFVVVGVAAASRADFFSLVSLYCVSFLPEINTSAADCTTTCATGGKNIERARQ